MKEYLITEIVYQNEKIRIITLLDYRIKISKCLKSIKIFPIQPKEILVDTLLCSGMNEYRFIKTELNDKGEIRLDRYNYIIPEEKLLKEANDIIKENSFYLRNSILSEAQIKKILLG